MKQSIFFLSPYDHRLQEMQASLLALDNPSCTMMFSTGSQIGLVQRIVQAMLY
jgi:hypothetical protein